MNQLVRMMTRVALCGRIEKCQWYLSVVRKGRLRAKYQKLYRHWKKQLEMHDKITGLKDSQGEEIRLGQYVVFPDSDVVYEVTINPFNGLPVVDSELGQEMLTNCHSIVRVINTQTGGGL